MPSCVFRGCKNYGAKIMKSGGVTYHTFPSEELLRHKWVSKVRAQRREHDWMPTKSSTICSAHFKDEDKYITTRGYVRLKKCAVPVISSDLVPPASTPTCLEDVNISDTDSIFDTPTTATLKNRVRKLKLEKNILQKKNKVLKNRNKRLTQRIICLKNIVKILKKKNYNSEHLLSEPNIKAEPINLSNRVFQIKEEIKIEEFKEIN